MCQGIFLGTEANWHVFNKLSQPPKQSGSIHIVSWEWPPDYINVQAVLWSFWETINNRLKLHQGLFKQSHSSICHISMTKNIPQLYLIYCNQGVYAACAAESSSCSTKHYECIYMYQGMVGNGSISNGSKPELKRCNLSTELPWISCLTSNVGIALTDWNQGVKILSSVLSKVNTQSLVINLGHILSIM